MDEDVLIVCDGKEREGMFTMGMCASQYIEDEEEDVTTE